jgi:hypothetical protein
MRRLTLEEFNSRLIQFEETNKVKVLSNYEEYEGNGKPLKCLCLVCGNEVSPSMASLSLGAGCKLCAAKNRGRAKKFTEEKYNSLVQGSRLLIKNTGEQIKRCLQFVFSAEGR